MCASNIYVLVIDLMMMMGVTLSPQFIGNERAIRQHDTTLWPMWTMMLMMMLMDLKLFLLIQIEMKARCECIITRNTYYVIVGFVHCSISKRCIDGQLIQRAHEVICSAKNYHMFGGKFVPTAINVYIIYST